LHNVPGFYSLLPALILALTGMVFAFKWFSTFVYVAASGTTAAPPRAEVRSVKPVTVSLVKPAMTALDKAFEAALVQLPEVKRIGITPPFGPEGTISVYGYRRKEAYYGYDALQFDQYTGRLLHRRNDSEKNRGERLIDMNYDIHVGSIGGLVGKIVAFVISLICASLPVTGFLVWWGKRKKPVGSGRQAGAAG
jgi:uncharacterized iron-regulated membrane protein